MKKNKISILLIGSILIGSTIYMLLQSFNMQNKKQNNKGIILLGGLDDRTNYKSIDEQVDLVRKGSDYENILGFRYSDLNGILKAIDQHPTYSVILFSAGCRYSFDVAKKMKEYNNIRNLYLVEPYALSQVHTNNAKKSVDLGLPEENIFVGNSQATGLGIVNNPTRTSNCTPKHWCALTDVGEKIKSKVKKSPKK